MNKKQRSHLLKVFFHEYGIRKNRIKRKDIFLCHYCPSEAAYHILKSNSVWLRNTAYMNDSSEIQHGMQMLIKCYNSNISDPLKNIIEYNKNGSVELIESNFNKIIKDILFGTYIFCLSEIDISNNANGLLSMWRAYAPKNGALILFEKGIFFNEIKDAGLMTIPVQYETEQEFELRFTKFVNLIVENMSELSKSINFDEILSLIIFKFVYLAVGTKNPAFSEEKEWRIVFLPGIVEGKFELPHIQSKSIIINGCPNTVYEFNYKKLIDQANFDFKQCINSIVIGPSVFPVAIGSALVQLMHEVGFSDPAKRVRISDIPLRLSK